MPVPPHHSFRFPKRRLIAAGAMAAVVGLAGCGASNNPISKSSSSSSSKASSGKVIVGSANFTESQVLGQLYAQAIGAKGVHVETKPNIGSRELYIKALQDKSISVVPEYTGNLLQYFDKNTKARTSKQVDNQLPEMAKKKGFRVLQTSSAIDQDTYVVSQKFAKKHDVKSLKDLSGVSGGVTVGGPTELKKRPYGPKGLKKIYNIKVSGFKQYDSPAVKVKDLKDGKIQTADFFSTDAAIADNNFVALKDPKEMILPQNVVPLVRPDVKKNSKAVDAMNTVDKKLTTHDLAHLNKKVDVKHQKPRSVAKAWLKKKDLG
jgi:osmoprotectant transport system substrate-binding protein